MSIPIPSDTTTLAIGGSAGGQFNQSADGNWFKVALTAGQTYLFTMTSAAQGDGNITDFNGIFMNLVSAEGQNLDWEGYAPLYHSPVMEFTATRTGDYYLVTEQDEGGPYAATYKVTAAVAAADDFTDGAGAAGALTVGTAVNGNSEVAGDRDWFKFHADAGQHYSFDGQLVAGQTPVIDVRIYDAGGKLLTPGGTVSGFDALASGDYYVSVEGDGRGAYTLLSSAATDDYGRTNAGAGVIAPGQPASGHIDYAGDVDRFSIAVHAGAFYTVEVAASSAGTVHLQWFDGAGKALTAVSEVQTASGAWDYTLQASTTGNDYIEANSFDAPTLAYTLIEQPSSQDDYGDTIANAANVRVGASTAGTIQSALDIDMFKVDLQAGTTYTFALQPQAANGVLALTLSDGDGKVLHAYTASGASADKFFTFTPTASGSYYMAASAAGTTAGAYTLSATATVDDAGASATTAGQLAVGAAALHGELEKGGGDIDWYAVHLDAGNTYWFTLSGLDEGLGTLQNGTQLSLLDAQGNVLATTTGLEDDIHTAPVLPFAAAGAGTYYVEVASPGAHTGTYQLQAQIGIPDDYGNDAQHATHIGQGKAQAGVIELVGDKDVFAIDVVAGTTYSLVLATPGAQNNVFELTLAVADANHAGVSLAGQGDGEFFTAAATGTYYVTVGGNSLNGSGSHAYTLTEHSNDRTPPVLTGATASAGLGLSDDIRLDFNESVMLATDNGTAVTLTDANGVSTLLSVSNGTLSVAGHTLIIDPAVNLAPGMSYTLGVNGLSDLAGNAYGPASFTFHTVDAVAQGTDGNDYLVSKADGMTLDGGAGIDTVYYGGSGATVLQDGGGHWLITQGAGQADTLVNIERIVTPGAAVALDIDGHGGQAYRLYQAAFDRAPDQAGLGYWIAALDKGASLHDVAGGFVQSAEFAALYGANTSDDAYLTLLYNNVLHRAPDAGGAAYWMDAFQHGLSRADALTSFSESAENQAALIGQMAHGIAYTPDH